MCELYSSSYNYFLARNYLSFFFFFCSFCLINTTFCFVLQENSKTKHPQLLYEAKLYNILQGGSMCLVQLYILFTVKLLCDIGIIIFFF